MIRISLAVATTALLCACQPTSSDRSPTTNTDSVDLVARYDGHEISVSDVDARILALPRSERPKPGTDMDTWFEQQTREVAMDALLLEDAQANGLANEREFVSARQDFRTRMGLQLCLQSLHPDAELIQQDEIRTAYEARQDEMMQPERRSVLYIYKRGNPDGSVDAARAEAESLRMRILGGESFSRLATDHSDSETRHKDGSLGWLTSGELPPALDRVVFGLEEGVPSEALTTPDGAHLFFVQKILPGRTQSLKEVQGAIRTQLVAERRTQALAELEAESTLPPGSVELDRASFDKIMSSGEPEALVLRIGDRSLTAAGLRTLIVQSGAHDPTAGDASPADRAWTIYQATRRRDLVYQHCLSAGHISADDLSQRTRTWEDKALLKLVRQRRLLELAGSDEAGMRSFYQSNIGQFSTTPTWQLKHLSIPLGPEAPRIMAALENEVAAGDADIDALATRFGGVIDEWPPSSLPALARRDVRLVTLISPLDVGQLSAPYRTGNGLELVKVMARNEARAHPFEQVRIQVTAAYVKQYTEETYRKLSDRMLADAHFEIVPDGPARLRARGLPQIEVTVEELESMIEQL